MPGIIESKWLHCGILDGGALYIKVLSNLLYVEFFRRILEMDLYLISFLDAESWKGYMFAKMKTKTNIMTSSKQNSAYWWPGEGRILDTSRLSVGLVRNKEQTFVLSSLFFKI